MDEEYNKRLYHLVGEINRRLNRTKEPFIDPLSGKTYYFNYSNTEYHIDICRKYSYIRDNNFNICFPKGYIFIKIDSKGNIYHPNGKKPLASIYSDQNGTEYLDKLYPMFLK